MRRPLCTGLLVFLALWLAAALALPRVSERRQPEPAGVSASKESPDVARQDDLQMILDALDGEKVLLCGKAAQLYEPADGSQEKMSFMLEEVGFLSDSFQNSGKNLPLTDMDEKLRKQNKKVLCYVDAKEGSLPKAGSFIKVRGVVMPFDAAANPGAFDAAAYYERQDCVFSLHKATVEAESAGYDRAKQGLFELRRRIALLYVELLGEKDGEVAAAMVLGIKKGMDSQVKALYDGASISHLLVVSGLHVSMIGMGILSLLKKCRVPLLLAAIFSGGLLVLYGSMTGMSVSTRRALLMFGLLLLAKLVRRTADVPTSLAVAACIILVPQPEKLQDAGFLLSFSAVAGAAVLVPMLQDVGLKAARRNGGSLAASALGRMLPQGVQKICERAGKFCFQGIAASLGITLAMLLFLLTFYYKWNPWSIAANLVVIPLMSLLLPQLLFLAATGLLFGNLHSGIAFLKVLALPAKLIFFLYEKICELVLWLPGSSLHTGMPQVWQVILFEAGLLALIKWGRKVPPWPRLLLAGMLTCTFLLRLPQEMQITMLDVGQGECVYLETPQHHVWLLDAGSTSERSAGQYQIVPFLRYEGVRRIEGIVVSHWDEDHVNALADVFSWAKTEQVEIGGLFLPDACVVGENGSDAGAASDAGAGWETDTGAEWETDAGAGWETDANPAALLELAESYGIRIERVHAGQRLRDGKMTLRCLHPVTGEMAASRNASSVVLRLDYGNFSALFTGDLEEEGERWLTEQYGTASGGLLDCDLLDAGHHGAANATTEEFLAAVSPQAVLISCGQKNHYGHPAPETLQRISERGIPFYVTAQKGAITVKIGRGKTEVLPMIAF